MWQLPWRWQTAAEWAQSSFKTGCTTVQLVLRGGAVHLQAAGEGRVILKHKQVFAQLNVTNGLFQG